MAGPRARVDPSKLKATDDLLDSLWVPILPPSLTFGRNSASPEIGSDEEDLELEGCSRVPEKKRRLSAHHVRFPERSFEAENRLEPERKAKLAKEIGLQPGSIGFRGKMT